ncbi:MAG: terminase [Lachnospiraceae bacterium]
MSSERLVLSEKYKAFLRCDAPVEFLEGTTAAGKTTVGLFKFMLKVAKSPKKLHIIAAKDTGTAEKNIINKDLGIVDDFGILVQYNGNGTKDDKISHLLFHTNNGDKIIYIMGYGDKTKWQKALGGQYGCLYIDEINTADIEFVREAAMRCDYLMATLNPDDPSLDVYKEYINCSRPLKEWEEDTPKEILDELIEEPKPGWVHWFFSFVHNLGLSKEKIEQIIRNTPKGTKIWKNKILGLRGKATGLIFSNFDRKRHVVKKGYVKQFVRDISNRHQKEYFIQFSAGLDTAYSQKSPDTISMSFIGITNFGKFFVLDEKVYNNADVDTPLAPTDTVRNFIDFLERNRKEWGFAKDVFIDSADQATITEFLKYKRLRGCIYNFNDAWKKEKIIDRISNQLNWFAGDIPCSYIIDTCVNYIRELETYSWLEDKDNTPEDKNDHMVNSVQYAWLPYEMLIGTWKKKK